MGSFLTELDERKIEAALEWIRKFQPPNKYGEDPHVFQAPDVYIARTPTGGIPKLDDQGTVGTGGDDIPGYAECEIWRINESTEVMEAYVDLDKTVYNISTAAIPEDTWILIHRTKQGKWVASPTGGGGPRYAQAVSDWEDNAGDPRVYCVSVDDRAGTNPGTDNFYVYLPRTIDADPAVYEDGIILYSVAEDGVFIGEGDYMNGKVGDVRQTTLITTPHGTSTIPEGWEELTNAAHRVLLSRDTGGESNEGTLKGTGGFRWHGDYDDGNGKNNHPDHDAHVDHDHHFTDLVYAWDKLTNNTLSGTASQVFIQADGVDPSDDMDIGGDEMTFEEGEFVDPTKWTTGATPVGSGTAEDESDIFEHSTHLGDFKSDTTTDNRMPFYVVLTIVRVK